MSIVDLVEGLHTSRPCPKIKMSRRMNDSMDGPFVVALLLAAIFAV